MTSSALEALRYYSVCINVNDVSNTIYMQQTVSSFNKKVITRERVAACFQQTRFSVILVIFCKFLPTLFHANTVSYLHVY